MLADQSQGLRAVGVLQSVKEEIFALQRAKYGDVQCLLDWFSETEQQRVRKIDDVGRRLVLHPVNKLEDFFTLKSIFTFQNGNSHLAEHLWIRRDRTARCQTQNRFRVPQTIEPARRLAKHGNVLFEISTDAA